MTATDKGFIVIGECPRLPPLEELEALIDKLDNCRKSVDGLRDQERSLCDQKIYIKSDDMFHEVELVRQTRKRYFVQLPCGTSQCLPSRLLDDLGQYTRRTGPTVQYWQGWRARQDLLSLIDQADKSYAYLTNVIPGVVRSVRTAGSSVPHDLVQRLKSHYGR